MSKHSIALMLEGLRRAGADLAEQTRATAPAGVTIYGKYRITYDPGPWPPYSFVHDDYDGAPDALSLIGRDPRCGRAESIEAAKRDIDWIEHELLGHSIPDDDAEELAEQTRVTDGEAPFDAWITALAEDVIQGEFGFEPGEFGVFPEMWRSLYDEGLTPLQAYQRAMDAHKAARDEDDRAKQANWERIQREDAATSAVPDDDAEERAAWEADPPPDIEPLGDEDTDLMRDYLEGFEEDDEHD